MPILQSLDTALIADELGVLPGYQRGLTHWFIFSWRETPQPSALAGGGRSLRSRS